MNGVAGGAPFVETFAEYFAALLEPVFVMCVTVLASNTVDAVGAAVN